MFRKILTLKLRIVSALILKKYRPKIVAITGSVGKSSAKEAVFQVLRGHFFVRKNEGNFNTEIGVPLTMIGSDTAGKNIFKWVVIFLKAVGLLLGRAKYPEVLVLEMGADRVGELERLMSWIKPDVSVVTTVGISHLEFFKTREAIRREKGALIRALSENGMAILNADDEGSSSLKSESRGRVLTYGLSDGADVKASELVIEENDGKFGGTSFELSVNNSEQKIVLRQGLGQPMASSALAAAAVALVFKIPLPEIAEGLRDFKSLAGRLQVFDGSNGSVIIDDTYNSAPASLKAALDVLKSFPGKRKICVLGKMAELGEESEKSHKEIGEYVVGLNLDYVFVKNNEAKLIGEEAVAKGFDKEKLIYFSSNGQAVSELKNILQAGDVILFKASQSEYFEDLMKELLQYSEDHSRLIQRDYTRK